MILSRRLALVARVSMASAWAGCLVILGLWLAVEGGRWLPIPRAAAASAGVGAIAAGLFVFMVVVADRLVPGVGRRQRMWPLEMLVLLLIMGGFAGVIVSYLR